MILHAREKKHQIQVLLDTGCSVALLNQQTVEKLGIRKKAHRQPHSIENYTGQSVKGAGQFYTNPCSSNTENITPKGNSKSHQWNQESTPSSLLTG